MAQISDSQKQVEGQFMNEYWNLRKKIATTELADNYWEYAFHALVALEQKYTTLDPANALYYKGIILACVNDLQYKDETRKFRSNVETDFVRGINALRKLSGLPLVEVQR